MALLLHLFLFPPSKVSSTSHPPHPLPTYRVSLSGGLAETFFSATPPPPSHAVIQQGQICKEIQSHPPLVEISTQAISHFWIKKESKGFPNDLAHLLRSFYFRKGYTIEERVFFSYPSLLSSMDFPRKGSFQAHNLSPCLSGREWGKGRKEIRALFMLLQRLLPFLSSSPLLNHQKCRAGHIASCYKGERERGARDRQTRGDIPTNIAEVSTRQHPSICPPVHGKVKH